MVLRRRGRLRRLRRLRLLLIVAHFFMLDGGITEDYHLMFRNIGKENLRQISVC